MISGAHAIIYSRNAEADKKFLKDILKLSNVDVGRGWLIFGLPPSEIAVHPTEGESTHEIYLMCDSIADFVKQISAKGIDCSPVQDQGWGLLSELTLPGGGKLGVYEPRHARPEPMHPKAVVKKKATAKKKVAKKKSAVKKKPAKKVAKKAAKKPVSGKKKK